MGDRERPAIDPLERTYVAEDSAAENQTTDPVAAAIGTSRTLAAPAPAAEVSGFERTHAGYAADSGFDRTLAAPAGSPGAGSGTRDVGAFDKPNVRFEERDELGRGGMGRVAAAFDRVLVRPVAVKHILSSDPAAVERFAREARITARLEHPGIVPVHDTGRNPDGSPFYVMRRIDGRPLSEAVPKGSASSDLAQRLALVPNLLAACDAVAYAHAHGIVHRDLKPANILLGPFGETLVIDWGLARAADERDDGATPSGDPMLTIVGAVSGTPGYMAPEQARGESFDARGDVFALGATLFYLLAGRLPHAGDTVAELIERAASAQTPDWTRLPAGVPDDLRAILGKALAGDAADRYADAGALAADLRHFVTGNLVGAHRYSRLERLRRFIRRHRTAVAIAAISLAAIVAISVIAIRRVVDERDEATRARQLETERANELAIAQAQLLVDTNPTRAVALVRPLAFGARWRDARNVVAAASARGVPWRLPSSAVTVRAELSPDGLHAYSVGDDGVIRIYDLRTRTARIAMELGRRVTRNTSSEPVVELLDASRLAVFEGSTLTIIDARARSRTAIPLGASVRSGGFRGNVLYWVDIRGRAWRLDGGRPVWIPVDDQVREIQASPDGSHFAVQGERATWIVTKAATLPVIGRPVRAIAWHPASISFVAVTQSPQSVFEYSVLSVRLTPIGILSDLFPVTVTDLAIETRSINSAAVANNAVILQDIFGISINGTKKVAFDAESRHPALVVARDQIVVGATTTGYIDVLDDGRHHRMRAPVPKLDWIASASASPYLMTGGGSLLLLWDLDAIIPRRGPKIDMRRVTVGPHHELLGPPPRGGWEKNESWFDLRTLTARPGPTLTGIVNKFTASDRRVLVRDTFKETVRLLRRDTTESVEIARGVKLAALLDDRRVVLVTANHRVELRDTDANTTTVLFTAPSEPRWLYAKGDYVVIAVQGPEYKKDLAIRYQISTRVESKITVPRDDLEYLSDLDATGRFWFADATGLKVWSPAGDVVTHTTLPGPFALLVPIDGARYVLSTGAASYIVDTTVPGSARPTIPLRTRRGNESSNDLEPGLPVSTSSDGLLAVPGVHGSAQIVDTITGAVWSVGQSGTKPTTARLSRDGSVLYENRGGRLVYWRLDLPDSPGPTALRAALVTNAELAPDGTVSWPSL